MEFVRLKAVLRQQIVGLHVHGHKEIPNICSRLGLPVPRKDGSRRDRMEGSFDAVADETLHDISLRFLNEFSPSASIRNDIQDLLWADDNGPPINKKVRREIAQAMTAEDLYLEETRFDTLLTNLWVVDEDSFAELMTRHEGALRHGIDQHVYANLGDWSPEHLFGRLGAFECSHKRFRLFLEGMASSNVRPNEAEQRRFVDLVNRPLKAIGAELRETDSCDGYPVFSVVAFGVGAAGRPKNIIFASSHKPDLRFRDALNNDIEIVTNAERVLVYDRPISSAGVLWRDLQDWWAERAGGLLAPEAKSTLYRRLCECLPQNSPPQQSFFRKFFEAFGPLVPDLPALLPEVWLHWDPKTVKERGTDALTRFRMDFLMLLPNNVHIVIEVDGKHHFADERGYASSIKYGEMMAADRDLRLAGYEVYRFGAAELDPEDPAVRIQVKHFFEALFKLHGVSAKR